MYTKLLNPVDNLCQQLINGLILRQQSLNEVQFNRFYLWLFYFQCLQAISLFQALKAQDNIQS